MRAEVSAIENVFCEITRGHSLNVVYLEDSFCHELDSRYFYIHYTVIE